MTTIKNCSHIESLNLKPTTIVRHTSIPGAPTRVDDLDTETHLCGICSGVVVSMLQHLENGERRVITLNAK